MSINNDREKAIEIIKERMPKAVESISKYLTAKVNDDEAIIISKTAATDRDRIATIDLRHTLNYSINFTQFNVFTLHEKLRIVDILKTYSVMVKDTCPYCGEKVRNSLNDTANSNFDVEIKSMDDNEPFMDITYDDNNDTVEIDSVYINYCPMCGRKL